MRTSTRIKPLKWTWSGVALLLVLSARVFAATFTVTTTADSGPGSLRAAIASAANGDTINFNLAYPATILLSSPLTLGPSVTITGPGASDLAISGGDLVAVLIVNAGATAAISGLTIEHGSSLLGGGIFNAGTLTLTGCVISNNTVGNQLGGGILNAGTMSLISSTVSGNSAGTLNEGGRGGGIYNYQGTLTLTNSTVSDNTALGNNQQSDPDRFGIGGGIENEGTLTLTNSTVSQNTAMGANGAGLGGGIDNGSVGEATAILTLVGSTVSGNQADWGAGGILASGSVSLLNSTISGNSCGSADNPSCDISAAGIYWVGVYPSHLLTMSFTTVSGNSCYGICSGGIWVDTQVTVLSQPPVVKNTILANNSPNETPGNCIIQGGQFVSGGYNLSDDATCASFLTQTGDLNSTPAGLDPAGLQNNGGPTQTIGLLPTSPAVNAIPLSACTDASGNPVTTDQRGVPRPQGSGCDIGAFEYFHSLYVVPAVQTFLLIDAVQSSTLPRIVQGVLKLPLQAAVDSLNQGNLRAAAGQLEAFVILVDLGRLAGALSQQEAATWTASAQQIIQSLQGLIGAGSS